jgi:hypothetical protein
VTAITQIVRYRGDTEEERRAAFAKDAAVRSAAGWTVAGQTSEYVLGVLAPELVVTYQREAGAGIADYPTTAPHDSPDHGRTRSDTPATRPRPPWTPAAPPHPPAGWGSPSGPASQPTWNGAPAPTAVRASGNAWLRRLLVFGSAILFTVFSGLPPADWNGLHPSEGYFWMGMETGLIGTFLLGLGLYAAGWRVIHPAIWRIVAVVLVILAAICTLVTLDYFGNAAG